MRIIQMALHVAMGIGRRASERERETSLRFLPSQRSDEGGEPIEPRKIKMKENDEPGIWNIQDTCRIFTAYGSV